MSDPFKTPATAHEEMAERIEVLRRQAAREQSEAADMRKRADELEASADLRLSIASEYEAIAILPRFTDLTDRPLNGTVYVEAESGKRMRFALRDGRIGHLSTDDLPPLYEWKADVIQSD